MDSNFGLGDSPQCIFCTKGKADGLKLIGGQVHGARVKRMRATCDSQKSRGLHKGLGAETLNHFQGLP